MKRFALLVLLAVFSACNEPILHGLEEFPANQVKVHLSKQGIASKKVLEGGLWKIEVPSGLVNNALELIEESRILKNSIRRSKKASSGGIIKTREERKGEMLREQSTSLEESLESLPGVLEAHVHIHNKDSASVLLISSKGVQLDSVKLKKLVSGAIGVKKESITIVSEEISEEVASRAAPSSAEPSSSTLSKGAVDYLPYAGVVLVVAGIIGLLAFLKSPRKRKPKLEPVEVF